MNLVIEKSGLTPRASGVRLAVLLPLSLAVLSIIELIHYVAPASFPLDPVVLAVLEAPAHAPFQRNFRSVSHAIRGDLTSLGNQPLDRHYPVIFSTDHIGFRRTPGTTPENARILLVEGQSFLWGSTLSDDETLPAQLEKSMGLPTYNGGRYVGDDDGIDELNRLTHRLPRLDRVVVMVLQRSDLLPERPPVPGPITRAWRVLHLPDSLRLRLRAIYRTIHDRFGLIAERRRITSPLLLAGQRLESAFTSAGLLGPGERGSYTLTGHLSGGQRFVFRSDEEKRILNPPSPAAVELKAEAIAQMVEALRPRYQVTVVLLPDKLAVYAPLLQGNQMLASRALQSSDALMQALRQRSIEPIDLLPSLQEAALHGGLNDLQFYQEDSHWTASGVRTSANAIASVLQKNPRPAPQAAKSVSRHALQ